MRTYPSTFTAASDPLRMLQLSCFSGLLVSFRFHINSEENWPPSGLLQFKVRSRLDIDSTDSLVCLGTYTDAAGDESGTTWTKMLSNYIGELK
jgi:hypothetical protein